MFNRENQFWIGRIDQPAMRPSVSGSGGTIADPRIFEGLIRPECSRIGKDLGIGRTIPLVFTPDSNIDKPGRREKDPWNGRPKQTPYYPRGDGRIEPKNPKDTDNNPPRPSHS